MTLEERKKRYIAFVMYSSKEKNKKRSSGRFELRSSDWHKMYFATRLRRHMAIGALKFYYFNVDMRKKRIKMRASVRNQFQACRSVLMVH